MMDFSHFNYYLKNSVRLVDDLVNKGIKPKVLKLDAYNEILDLPDVGGIAGSIGKECCTLLEYEYVFARKARMLGYDVVQGDIRNLPFGDGEFNLLLDLSTLDHIKPEEVAKTLDGYVRVLEPGGKILLVCWVSTAPHVLAIGDGVTWTSLNQYFFEPEFLKEEFSKRFVINSEDYLFNEGGKDMYLIALEGTRR